MRLGRKAAAKPVQRGGLAKAVGEVKDDVRARGVWTERDRLGTRLFLGVICLGVIAGPAACVMTAAKDRTSALPAAPATSDHSQEYPVAAGAAVRFVRDWLSLARGEEDVILGQMVQGSAPSLELPDKRPMPPRSVDARSIAPAGERLWRVGVLVDTSRAYDVIVAVSADHHPAVVMLPSQVAVDGPDPRTQIERLDDVATSHPSVVTAAGFAKALLTGSEDITRWTAPDTVIAPVTPPACVEATVTQAESPVELDPRPADGATALVAVTVRCQLRLATTATPAPVANPAPGVAPAPQATPAGGVRTLSYALQMTGRGGRWEVAGLAARPIRTDAAQRSTPSTSSKPGSTVTATPR